MEYWLTFSWTGKQSPKNPSLAASKPASPPQRTVDRPSLTTKASVSNLGEMAPTWRERRPRSSPPENCARFSGCGARAKKQFVFRKKNESLVARAKVRLALMRRRKALPFCNMRRDVRPSSLIEEKMAPLL